MPGLKELLLFRADDFSRPALFGQSLPDLLPTALASERVAAVVVHDRVQGEPPERFFKGRSVPARAEEVAAARSLLRASGFREERIDEVTSIFVMNPPPDDRRAFLVLRGPGWDETVYTPNGTRRVRLKLPAEFSLRVVGIASDPLALSLTLAPEESPAVLTLRGPEGVTRTVTALPGARIRLSLGTLRTGTHEYALLVDRERIVVENPTVATDGP